MPILTVVQQYPRQLVLATGVAIATFVVFYLMTVFTLSWGVTELGYARRDLLGMQMISVLFFALMVPLSGLIADRRGGLWTQKVAALAVIGFGIAFAPLFGSGSRGELLTLLCGGLAVMGLVYGPISALLGSLFPTNVRYTGTSVSFNLAGILGGSLAPYFATSLASHYGLASVGYYMSAAGLITLIALLCIGRNSTKFAVV